MILKKAGSSSVTRTSVPAVAAQLHVGRRRAASSAAGKCGSRHCREIAHHAPKLVRSGACTTGPIKKSRTSGLFWGLASHNMDLIDFRPDDISYPPVQPV